ncbi:12672_t:CDS:2 [Cetraspora pellucida]|uniref:12672_t:CDS:1 n=1 Tax=Cetraspora pellucida TaxID=1433469 RepID=A0A9N9HBA8_9GLOM|nr:12672_t:CDS:2 [Cetraspora pellucida]
MKPSILVKNTRWVLKEKQKYKKKGAKKRITKKSLHKSILKDKIESENVSKIFIIQN